MSYTRKTRIRPLLLEAATATLEPKGQSETRHLRLSHALWGRVLNLARTEHRNCTNMVQVLVEEALKGRGL